VVREGQAGRRVHPHGPEEEVALDLVALGFDTATEDTAVCAMRDGEVVHESLLDPSPEGKPEHASVLLGEVERAVVAAGGWAAIDLIGVGVGPGSFTGVRIGIATARGVAASAGLPVAGVCTLDAIASALRGQGGEAEPPSLLAILDARRGEVFAALYTHDGERVWEPLVSAPDELAKRVATLPRPLLAAGSGALRFRQELVRQGVEIPDGADPVHRVAARHICALAAARGGDEGPLAPIYLRPPDAVRWHERDTVQRAE
jgi:tRNA threonylcarbamoyladenosine biosynthesis protein TsaB